jgi:hypothetical protein
MAKSHIRQYVFTPSTNSVAPFNGTVKIPGKYDLNQVLLITNTTKNVIIYNFADANFANSTISFSRANDANFTTALDNTDGVTTITLVSSNTYSMSSSDTIQIFVEKGFSEVRMPEIGTDAFERTRVAQPRSMLDADFEYGLQPTKWLTYDLLRGYPSVYELPGTDLSVSTVTTDASPAGANTASLITVTTSIAHGLSAGQPITVKGYLNSITGFARAEGSFIVNTVPGSPTVGGLPSTFTYYAKAKVGTTNGDVISTTYTQVRQGGFYTGAAVGTPTFTYSNGTSPSTVTVTFANNHGFMPGNTILAATSETIANGPYFVETVPTATSITYTARVTGTITGTITGAIYARPDAYFSHRPFDGGVILGTGGPAYGAMSVRQSKKYIRYQSGKAINYNTGALFSPNYDIRSITATGTAIGSTITVVTDDVDHGCQVGASVTVVGVTTSGYNGTYTVAGITDERTLTFLATSVLGATTGVITDPCILQITGWYGSTVRAGTFDEQNGMFWQWDGQTLAVGKRSSTFQLAGTIAINTDANAVTGTSTRFAEQLVVGDRIVIRGMTHVVSSITSNTAMTVTPDFRGAASVTGVKAVKTIDYIVPQSSWNGDRIDGTNSVYNSSGYRIDLQKMQMIGLQWTWYGAGFIDWMLRGPEGKYITVHRLRGNNLNKEAYMRSGNMPVRYEVVNESARSYVTATVGTGDTSISIADLTYFPTAGTVFIDNEIITYTGKSATTGAGNLTGCGRAATLSQFVAGASRSFTSNASVATTHAVNAGVLLIGQTATPSISHWGSAFITDGGFDEDRGYIFNYQATNISISTRKTTAFAIRLAPSVSNAIIGDLGVRELINRAQLLLQGIEITAGGSTNANSALVIEGVLNPSNYPSNVANITWNGLSSTAIQSGQPSFAQIAQGTSVTFNNTATNSTTAVIGQATGVVNIPVAAITGIVAGDDIASITNTSIVSGGSKVTAVTATASPTFTGTTVTANTGVTSTNATIQGTTFTAVGIPTGGAAAFSVGQVLTGSNVAAGTYITGGPLTGTANAAGATWSVSINQTVPATTITGTLYTFAPTAITGTIIPGMLLTGGSVTGGTVVIAGAAQNSALTGTGSNSGGTYALNQTFANTPSGGTSPGYVTLSSSTLAPITAGASLTFSRNTYALPGETVFSFIAGQSGRDALDLSPLKELTNTPIGGRGTYPNGPDVLFINVYLTQGAPILSNLVIRWGEAQA